MNRFTENIDFLIRELDDNRYYNIMCRVKEYICGNIDSKELIEGLNHYELEYMANTINKVINYWKSDVHYYVELPLDINFNTHFDKAIIACKHENVLSTYNYCKTIGPYPYAQKYSGFNDLFANEIKGNFESISDGTMLSISNWLKIVNKYPYLFHRLYALTCFNNGNYEDLENKVRDKINDVMENEINPYDNELDDVIDSISFVYNRVYVTKNKLNEKLGPFDSLLESYKDDEQVVKYKKVLRRNN